MTLTELQAKRSAILESLGVARVQFGERSIQYAEQERALQVIDREIMRLSGPADPRVFVIRARRGLE